jgi:hypothetical protein
MGRHEQLVDRLGVQLRLYSRKTFCARQPLKRAVEQQTIFNALQTVLDCRQRHADALGN